MMTLNTQDVASIIPRIRAAAFFQLFEPYGSKVAKRVLRHHSNNGGMSRYNKIPIYLEWANQKVTAAR
jgi:hypothetical protein